MSMTVNTRNARRNPIYAFNMINVSKYVQFYEPTLTDLSVLDDTPSVPTETRDPSMRKVRMEDLESNDARINYKSKGLPSPPSSMDLYASSSSLLKSGPLGPSTPRSLSRSAPSANTILYTSEPHPPSRIYSLDMDCCSDPTGTYCTESDNRHGLHTLPQQSIYDESLSSEFPSLPETDEELWLLHHLDEETYGQDIVPQDPSESHILPLPNLPTTTLETLLAACYEEVEAVDPWNVSVNQVAPYYRRMCTTYPSVISPPVHQVKPPCHQVANVKKVMGRGKSVGGVKSPSMVVVPKKSSHIPRCAVSRRDAATSSFKKSWLMGHRAILV